MQAEDFSFEIRQKPQISRIKCVVLDYDGTLTTLRRGWDKILSQYAHRQINPLSHAEVSGLEEAIKHLTDHAGGTTPKQLMSRLVKLIETFGLVSEADVKPVDFYARDYAELFEREINKRLDSFNDHAESYVISGVRPMLDYLRQQEVINYVVTGSCTHAVTAELKKLSMYDYFQRVYGASLQTVGNLKEDAVREIMGRHSLQRDEVLIIGDGSTEIRAAGTLELPAVGIASDEHRGGLCSKKREMLLGLGAHAIIADYRDFQTLWNWLHD